MDRPDPTTAYLVNDGREITVQATYVSRFSLKVTFPNGALVANGIEFENLAILLNDERVGLGPCRFVQADTPATGHLLFTREIYDYQQLFFQRTKAVLQSGFANIPLILEHQRLVRQDFKDYTADLTYSLNVYRSIFDAMDAECEGEPAFVREAVQQAVLANEGAEFLRFFDERVEALEHIVGNYSPEDHARHGFYFRRQVWPFILESALMRRTNLKPRGYSGDSEMMRMLYRQEDLGDTIFAKLMHRHPVSNPAAEAVRNRCKTIVELLRKAREKGRRGPGNPLKVLSVACGPAWEVNLLLQTPEDCASYEFSLLDQDPLALQEVAEQVAGIEKRLGAPVKVRYLQVSVRTMMSRRKFADKWPMYDFIYSMGLIDYLAAPVARALLGNLYQLLSPGAEMVIGNYHIWNPKRVYMEYWGDWALYYRTEDEFLDLLKSIPDARKSVFLDESDIQMFLRAHREA